MYVRLCFQRLCITRLYRTDFSWVVQLANIFPALQASTQPKSFSKEASELLGSCLTQSRECATVQFHEVSDIVIAAC